MAELNTAMEEEFVGDDSEADQAEIARRHWEMFLTRNRCTAPFVQLGSAPPAPPVLPPIQPPVPVKEEHQSEWNDESNSTADDPPELPPDFIFPLLNIAPGASRFKKSVLFVPPILKRPLLAVPAPPAPPPPVRKGPPSFMDRFRRGAPTSGVPLQATGSPLTTWTAKPVIPDRFQSSGGLLPSFPLRGPVAGQVTSLFRDQSGSLPIPEVALAGRGLSGVIAVQVAELGDVKPILIHLESAAPVGGREMPVSATESPDSCRDSPGWTDSPGESTASSASVSSGIGSLEDDSDLESRQSWDGDTWKTFAKPSGVSRFRRQALDSEEYSREQYEERKQQEVAAEKKRKLEQEAQAAEAKLAGLRRELDLEQQRLEQNRKLAAKIVPRAPRPKSELLAQYNTSLFPELVESAQRTVLTELMARRYSGASGGSRLNNSASAGQFQNPPSRKSVPIRPSRMKELEPHETAEKVVDQFYRLPCNKRKLSQDAGLATAAGRPLKTEHKKKAVVVESDGYESEEF